MAEKKSGSSGIRWDSPILIYGGLTVAALFFGKSLLDWAVSFVKSLHKDNSISPTGEPVASPLDTFRIRARFIEPENNGLVKASAIPWAMVKLKIELNNPLEQAKVVGVKVDVEWFPRTIYGGEKTTTNASVQLLAPVGRSTHTVEVSRPVTLANRIDAVAVVLVDGVQYSSVAFACD